MEPAEIPLPLYYTAADVARELGITRSAVGNAVQRQALRPDARLASGTPLFSSKRIDEYRDHHLGKVGRKPGFKLKEDKPVSTATTRPDLVSVRLKIKHLEMLNPGLRMAINSLGEQIAKAKKYGLDFEEVQEEKERLEQILAFNEREIGLGRDIHDRLSADTVLQLRAAIELSARDEASKEADFRRELPNAPAALTEQFSQNAERIRKLFTEDTFEEMAPAAEVSAKLEAWGFEGLPEFNLFKLQP